VPNRIGTLEAFFEAAIIEKLGWVLVHFVWQGAAVAAIMAVVLRLAQKRSAPVRYLIGCAAMAAIVVIPVVTFCVVDAGTAADAGAGQVIEAESVNTGAASAVVVQEVVEVEPAPRLEADVESEPGLAQKLEENLEAALPYIVAGWLLGILLMSTWHLGGWAKLQRLRRRMVREVEPGFKAKAQRLSAALGLSRAVAVMESALVEVPAAVGWLKPVILLPTSALTGLDPNQIEAILAHELAHIKRHDYLVNMLQTAVEVLGFYHPAVWWVSHRIRAERENCCDDAAVRLCGDRVRYVKALASMEEIRGHQAALAVAASGSNLLDRVRRLIGKDEPDEKRVSWLGSILAIVLVAGLMVSAGMALSGQNNEAGGTQGDLDGRAIIRKVLAKYSEMETYSATGEVISDIDMSGQMQNMPELKEELRDRLGERQKLRHTFSIKLARSGRYCIEWEQKVHPAFTNIGAVWSPDGQEHFLYNAGRKTSPKNREFALGAATGVSGGTANTTPSIFFGKPATALGQLQEISTDQEEIEGQRCYVISGLIADTSLKFKYWISSNTFLIRQKETIFGGNLEIPKMESSDSEFREAMEAMGEEVTEKKLEDYKKMMEQAQTQMKGIKGSITEKYREIKVNQPVESMKFTPDIDDASLNQRPLREGGDPLKSLRGLQLRMESADKLSRLARMLVMYANDHDGEYPWMLKELEAYDVDAVLEWALENVRYLARGGMAANPQMPVAYDKAMLMAEGGTNVLYNDGHVSFEDAERLVKLGIEVQNSDKAVMGGYPGCDNKTSWQNVKGMGGYGGGYGGTVGGTFGGDYVGGMYRGGDEDLRSLEPQFGAQEIRISTRLLIVPADVNAFKEFVEPGGGDMLAPAPGQPFTRLCDPNKIDKLIRMVQSHRQTNVLTSPRMTLLAGEWGTLSLTHSIKYIAGYSEPSDGGDPVSNYKTVNSGLEQEFRTVPTDSGYLLDIDYKYTTLLGFAEKLYKEKYPYKIPQTEVTSLQTRVFVPESQTLLIGGQAITDPQSGSSKMLISLVNIEEVAK